MGQPYIRRKLMLRRITEILGYEPRNFEGPPRDGKPPLKVVVVPHGEEWRKVSNALFRDKVLEILAKRKASEEKHPLENKAS